MGVIKDRSVPVLGLKLALVEDEEALAKIERNALPRDPESGALLWQRCRHRISRVCVPAFSNPNEGRDFVRASRNQKFPAQANLFNFTILNLCSAPGILLGASHQIPDVGEPVMRAFFPWIVVSSVILLAPWAHGNTLLPGPTGSTPTDKSFFLTFERSGAADLAFRNIVDRKGFYERDGWSRSDSSRIGAFNDDEGSRDNGFSSNLSFIGFNSKGSSAGIGGSFPGGPGFSGGAGNGGGGSLSGGGGFFNMKGLGEGAFLARQLDNDAHRAGVWSARLVSANRTFRNSKKRKGPQLRSWPVPLPPAFAAC